MVGLDFHILDPYEFEELVARLMKKLGYKDVKNRRGSSDGGIDVEATSKSAVAINHIAIQCKRYADNRVRLHHVRNLDSAVRNENFTTGIIITSGDFTPDAIEYAAKASVKIQLVDGEHLTSLVHRAFPSITTIREILNLDMKIEANEKNSSGSQTTITHDKINHTKSTNYDPLGMNQPNVSGKLANNVEPGSLMQIDGFKVKLVNKRQLTNLKLPKVPQHCSSCGMQLRGELRYCVKDDWFFGKDFYDDQLQKSKVDYCEHHPGIALMGQRKYCMKCDWHYN